MSDEFSKYLQYAQLSWAAYVPLDDEFTGPILLSQLTNPGIGFPTLLANQFSTRYTVLSHFEDSAVGLGFSATLFERINLDGTRDKILSIRGTNGPGDLLVDVVNVALAGSTILNPQYLALQNYIRKLSADKGDPLFEQHFTVTGHSLGGFLAQGLMVDSEFKDRIDHVYTYNAPGFGSVAGSILEALGVPNPLIDPASAAKITNLVASNGLSPIVGLGQHIGETVPVFIEAGAPLNNHALAPLTDALAVYDLFGKIDAQIEVQPTTDILNAMSAISGTSLEQAVMALQKLLLPTQLLTLQTGRREALYNAIQTVADSSHADGTKTVISLVGESASDLDTMAQFNSSLGLATRYALRELNPFVVAGSVDLYAPHNGGGALELYDPSTGAGELTEDYMTDRAAFLAKKMEINTSDGGLLTSLTNGFNEIHFKDYQSRYDISAGLFASIVTTPREFLFGSVNSDTLTGNRGDDRLYGGAGHDVLKGQDGTDHLEGNAGHDVLTGGAGENDVLMGGTGFDTYYYTTRDGHDQIEDADATGAIFVNGQMLVGGVKKAGQTEWESADGTITYEMSGTDLVVKLNDQTILTVNENFGSDENNDALMNSRRQARSGGPSKEICTQI